MKKTIATIVATTALLGLAACAGTSSSPTSKAPGTYVSESKSTNSDGTTVTTQQKTHVYKDSSGNKKAVVQTEKSSDPKGLFNKSTSTTTRKYE